VTIQGLPPHTEGEAVVKFVQMFAFFNARTDPCCTVLPRPMVQHYTVTPPLLPGPIDVALQFTRGERQAGRFVPSLPI
jgi:hypothetical protein